MTCAVARPLAGAELQAPVWPKPTGGHA